MPFDHVACRLPDESYRIGSLSRSANRGWVIRWGDGSEQRVQTLPMSYIPIEAGTLRYHALTEPAAFRAKCADDPAGVLARVLREASGRLSRADIGSVLRGAGLTDEEIAAAWKGGQKALLKDLHVRRDGKPPQYWWSDEELDQHATLRRYPPAAALAHLVKERDAGARAALIEAIGRRTDDQVLVATLAAALDAGDPPADEALAATLRTPLAAAASEPDVTEPVLSAAVPRLDGAARWLLAAWPRASRAVDSQDYATSQESGRTQLARAADELSSATSKDAGIYLLAAKRLVERTKPEECDASRLVELIRVADGAASHGPRGAEVIETCLGEWTDAPDEAARQCLDRVGIEGLRRGLTRLAFAKQSLRPRAMQRLADLQPGEEASPSLWADVTAEDLLTVADDPGFRRLLRGETVLIDVVRPKLTQVVARTLDARRLFSILSGHPDVVRVLDPDVVGDALIRVAESNQFVAGALSPLRSEGRLAELQHLLHEAEAVLGARARELESARETNARLREKINRLETRLRANAQAAASSTDADLGLARLESLRILADALIEIDFLVHAEVGRPALAERLQSIAKSSGLTQIAESGAQVSYDPRLHDALGVHHEPARCLSVVRVGYALQDGDGGLVLRRAQVVEE
jgi:hypothetical protein